MPKKLNQPVFYDAEKKRWRYTRLFFLLIATILIIIFATLFNSVINTPMLPSISLGQIQIFKQPVHLSEPSVTPTNTRVITAYGTPIPHKQFLTRQVNPSESDLIKSRKLILPKKSHIFHINKKSTRPADLPDSIPTAVRGSISSPSQAVNSTPYPVPTLGSVPGKAPNQTEVIGFFVNWDDSSFSSLKQNVNHIDKLIPEWLHLTDAKGTITLDSPTTQQQVLDFIHKARPTLPIAPLVNNYSDASGQWEGDLLGKMLSDPVARANTIQALLNYVQSNHFAGISVDFENIPDSSQADLVTFMMELYTRFHPLGLEVSQSVPADDSNYNYVSLAKYNDYLILMVYDQHWDGSTPGPVASQSWFADTLKMRFAEVDPSKYVVGIANYGYDWTDNPPQGTVKTFQEAAQIAQTYGAHISFDKDQLNSTYDYIDETGISHHAWFLDALSAFDQVAESHRYQVRGLALWRMGSEDPVVWRVFANRSNLNNTAAANLAPIQYGYGIVYQGSGEILKVISVPTDGQRSIGFDPQLGLITSQEYLRYPSAYVISRWGGSQAKKIAITFDDGPDPQWTPKILDVLKQNNATATFFIIGGEGDLNPGLLQELVNNGNEVGNHTFTHPDISLITQEQFHIELNATQRLFESVLKRQSVLFRPPYGEDVEPETPDQVLPLLFSSQLGYYTVGMKIDPQDYLSPGVDIIVQRVLDQVASGRGNIILLHDGGGDRSQTVAALPRIISELRAKGYQIVPVSDLMGLSRDQVMPQVSTGESVFALINLLGFQTINTSSQLLSAFFILGIILGLLRFLFVATLASMEKRRAKRRAYDPAFHPQVSMIVPAYNEAKVIDRTINTLLNSTYPGIEILVIDDGSSDNTYERLLELYGTNTRVRIFKKPNEGKAQALNFGIEQTKADIIIAMDADTVILADAAEKLVRHFSDPQVAAVAGNAKVGNRINLLTKLQALEYITGQNLDRRAFALLNCITVVPGAIGAWRRETILGLGGFANDTLAEDSDLTLRILRDGYKIEYEEDAIALTEAPDRIKGFLTQRFRWMYGTLQAAWKHLNTLMRPKYGLIGIVALPNILIFQILFPLISPLMDLAAVVSIGQIIWQKNQHPIDPLSNDLVILVLFYLFFLFIDFATALFSFTLETKEDWRLAIWILFQRFSYRQLMYYVVVKSVITAIQGRTVGWGKLERKATVDPSLGRRDHP
jgi:cellulose synthase/poly-beta-1,6-N-acetylglucosamine synthase-like glycosyltransferase/spore germination protein YaaH/peptidoglycan/xylan/chitin deacetylase (PgdA/CDA1 family)